MAKKLQFVKMFVCPVCCVHCVDQCAPDYHAVHVNLI